MTDKDEKKEDEVKRALAAANMVALLLQNQQLADLLIAKMNKILDEEVKKAEEGKK